MTATDFLASARAIVPILIDEDLPIGDRIEHAVQATFERVGCNTNLGIILLLAPLAEAALRVHAHCALEEELGRVLHSLSVADAAACFRAIRLANPAGLGVSANQDVAAEPTLPLRQLMGFARQRDAIAMQYTDCFATIFGDGLDAFERGRASLGSLVSVASVVFVHLLAAQLDSHIVRKHGFATALDVSRRACRLESSLKACENPGPIRALLDPFDEVLKSRGINPGTTADLTVATLTVGLLKERLGRGR